MRRVLHLLIGLGMAAGLHGGAAAQAGLAPPVRFGILPLGGAFESRNDWDPVLADLSRALGRPVSVLSVTSYEALEQAIQRNEVDMAFLSGRMALDAVTQRRMRVVAQVTRHDGLPGYRALLLSRIAGPFNTLAGLLAAPERWRLARGESRSVSGFIVPQLALFLPNQIAMETRFRSELVGTHQFTALVAGGDMDNTRGTVSAAGALDAKADGTLTNSAGTLVAGGPVRVTAQSMDNSAGAVQSSKADVRLTVSNALHNTNGTMGAGTDLSVQAGTLDNLGTGALRGTQDASVTVDGAALNEGAITAGRHLTLAAQSLDSAKASVLGAGVQADGQLGSSGDLHLRTAQQLAAHGDVVAAGKASLQGAGVDLGDSRSHAGDMQITATRGDVVTQHAVVSAAGLLQIDARASGAQTLRNDAGKLSAGQLVVGASSLSNTQAGEMVQTGAGAARIEVAGDIDNRGGSLGAIDDLDLRAGGAVQNTGGTIAANNALRLDAGTLDNTHGSVAAVKGALHVTTSGATTNTGGVMQAGQAVVLVNNGLVNTEAGRVIGDSLAIDTREQALDNRHGTLAATRTAVNRLQQIARAWTELKYTESVSRDSAGTSSDPAKIVAGGNMTLSGQLINTDSQVLAGGAITPDQAPENYQAKGAEVLSRNGKSIYHYWTHHGGLNAGTKWFNEETSYAPADTKTTFALPGWRYEPGTDATQHAKPPEPGKVVVGDQAGAAGTGTASGRGRTFTEVPANVTAPGGAAADGSGAVRGDGPMVVRTSTPDTRAPSASLFRTGNDGRYLVETDPRFAGYRNWLSSAYLFDALGLDPNNIQKRLGDGFYEQKLIREQIAQLTGYRYLEGFGNDEAQYIALMNAGATFAQQYGLRPGIALSAAQMAQLTSDIVWLVEQTVTLPDGSTQRVLVPQVYVRVRSGDIDGSGALLSGKTVGVKGGEDDKGLGDLVNTGTIAGRKLVSIHADNVKNLGGRIVGDSVGIAARNDLGNIGGSIEARNAAVLTAGHDINIRSTTSTQTSAQGSRTNLDRVAGLYVTNPGGTLIASAGTLGAITVNTPGKLTVEADQLVLATQTTKEDQSHTSAGRDLAWQKLVCQLDQKVCDVQSAKMALGLGVALAGGPAASYLLSSLPAIAAAAKMTAAACAAAPVLCANRAGLVVADLLASEALGGASLAGSAAGAKADNAILNRADALLYNDLAARAKI